MKKTIAFCIIITCCISEKAFVIDDLASGLVSINAHQIIEEKIYKTIQEHADIFINPNNSSLTNLYNTILKNLILEALKDAKFNVNMSLPDLTYNELVDEKNTEKTIKNLSLLDISVLCEDWDIVKKLLLHSANYSSEPIIQYNINGVPTDFVKFSVLNSIVEHAPLEVLQVLNDLNTDLAVLIGNHIPLYLLLMRYVAQRVPNEEASDQKAQESKQLRNIIIQTIQIADKENLTKTIIEYNKELDASIETNFLEIATNNNTYCGYQIIKSLLDTGVNPLFGKLTISKNQGLMNSSLYNIWQRFIDFGDTRDKEIILFILKNNTVEKASTLAASFDINEDGKYTIDHFISAEELLNQTNNSNAKKEFEKLIK